MYIVTCCVTKRTHCSIVNIPNDEYNVERNKHDGKWCREWRGKKGCKEKKKTKQIIRRPALSCYGAHKANGNVTRLRWKQYTNWVSSRGKKKSCLYWVEWRINADGVWSEPYLIMHVWVLLMYKYLSYFHYVYVQITSVSRSWFLTFVDFMSR